MLKATLLNDGSKGRHSAIHIDSGDNRNFLFDCGDTTYWKMKEMGISTYHVDSIFLTHKHGDHMRGFNQVFVGASIPTQVDNPKILSLYAPPGTDELIEHKLEGDYFIRTFIDLFVNEVSLSDKECKTTKYECRDKEFERIECETKPLKDNTIYNDKTKIVKAFDVSHNDPDVPCLAFSFSENKMKVNMRYITKRGVPAGKWISTDLQNALLNGDEILYAPRGDGGLVGLEVRQAASLDTTKISYITDLHPNEQDKEDLSKFAFGSDLIFCEANYTRRTERPSEHHMSAFDAATIILNAFDSNKNYKRIEIDKRFSRSKIKSPAAVLMHLSEKVDENDIYNEADDVLKEEYEMIIGKPGMQLSLI